MKTKLPVLSVGAVDVQTVFQRGHKLEFLGFPDLQPEFGTAIYLMAVVVCGTGAQVFDVSQPGDYACLASQRKAPGSNIGLVELYALPRSVRLIRRRRTAKSKCRRRTRRI